MWKLSSLVLIVPLLFVGCDKIKLKDNAPIVEKIEYSQESKDIASTMDDISKEDKKLIFTQFSGLHEYLSKTNKITKTTELFKVVESFQKDYGYTREKYKDYTDAVEAFLFKKGYKTPKTIVIDVQSSDKEMARSKVLEDMKTLSDAAKIAMEKKVNAEVQ